MTLGIGAFLDFMRGRWWIVPVAVCLVFALVQWGNARHHEKIALNRKLLIEEMRREAAEQRAKNEKRVADATTDYAERLASVQPIIIRSRDTVKEYAQTEAGRAPCLDAARVDGVRRDRESLFADPRTTESRTGAVPPASPSLRVYE